MRTNGLSFLLSLALLIVPAGAGAQQKSSSAYRFLVETAKPSSFYKCGIHDAGERTIRMGGLEWEEGFVLTYTSGPSRFGFATFPLGGKYDRISFVIGNTRGGVDAPLYTNDPNPYDTTVGIIGVYADGNKILDKKLSVSDTPEFITLDIKGVNELKFAIENSELTVGFADVILWTEGQTPKQTQNLPTANPKKIQLIKDLMPFMTKSRVIFPDHNDPAYDRVSQLGTPTSIKINGTEYTNCLYEFVTPAFVGEKISSSHFNLQGLYSKMSLVVGPADYDDATDGKAWITIKADGKILFEEEFSSTDVARREIFDLKHCNHLQIEFQDDYRTCPVAVAEMFLYPDGEDPEAEAKAQAEAAAAEAAAKVRKLPSPCKLVSSLPPYAIGSSVGDPVFNGLSQYVTFSMGGIKYNEGLILKSRNNVLYDDTPAFATFALAGEFDYVTFTTGWISKCGVLANDSLQVFCDDKLVYSDLLLATYPNKKHTVALHKCNSLKFQIKGSPKMFRPAFGVADIVVYRGRPVDNDLFVHEKPECPDVIDLLDLGLPYIHYVATMKDYPEKTLHDGSTKKKYFELGNERIYKGFMLQTIEHFDLEAGVTGEGGTGVLASTMGASMMVATVGNVAVSTVFPFGALLALASGGTSREASCAAFNTWGEYSTVTFKIASMNPANTNKKNKIRIGADGEIVSEFVVYEQMVPRTIKAPINKCNQLMFWMECGDGTSGQYLIYDVVLSK